MPEPRPVAAAADVLRRRWLALLTVLVCLTTAGCGLLLDEFMWLDRAPVVAAPEPAAAP